MPINQKITATFSEAMNSATILAPGTFTVTGPGVTPVPGIVTYDATNNIAIFAPTGGNFAVSTTFTATITTAAQSFPGGLPLASNYTWNFTTSSGTDTTAPSVTITNPADTVTGVATNQKITAAFNEGMDSTTINALTFTLTGPGRNARPGHRDLRHDWSHGDVHAEQRLANRRIVYREHHNRSPGSRREPVSVGIYLELHHRRRP